MASITCTRSDLFPNGTVVKAYPRSTLHTGQGGVPSGASVGEATMTSGTLTIEGLSAGQEYTLYAEVSGKDQYLGVQAPAASGLTIATGLPGPDLTGLAGWSFDPVNASSTFQLPTNGTLYTVAVPLKEQKSISKILLDLTTAGATLTAGDQLVGLFNEGTRKLLSKVPAAEVLEKWEGATGLIELALEAAIPAGPGFVVVGLASTGTTKPKLAAGALATAGVINAGGGTVRFGTADTGLTNALPNPAAAIAAAASPIWVGVK